MSDGYAPGDFAPSLRKIEASQLDYFVEGGQAVNIWAEVKAKCHNLAKLPNQEERNDAKHLGILMKILPTHFEALLEQALQHDPAKSDRKLLKEIKLLVSFRRDKWVRRVLEEQCISLDSAIPIERLRTCGLPKTEAFVNSEWPRTGAP